MSFLAENEEHLYLWRQGLQLGIFHQETGGRLYFISMATGARLLIAFPVSLEFSRGWKLTIDMRPLIRGHMR